MTVSICFPQKLRISYFRDLDFGNILLGVNETVVETSPNAGKFIIESVPPVYVTITFSMPAFLVNGINQIPISFTGTRNMNPDDNVPGEPFNPFIGTDFTFDPHKKIVYIRLGGTITVSTILPAGLYQSSIMIIVTMVNN